MNASSWASNLPDFPITFDDPFVLLGVEDFLALATDVPFGELIMACDLAESKGDMFRTAKQNGFRVNGTPADISAPAGLDAMRKLTDELLGFKIGRGKQPRFIIGTKVSTTWVNYQPA